jgi:hypothetical protein
VASASSINVTWQSPATGFVFNYKIEHSTVPTFDGGQEGVKVIDGPPVHGMNMSVTIDNLVLGRRYYIRISGRNHQGYGPVAYSSSFITPSLAPNPPVSVTVQQFVAAKGWALVTFPEVPCGNPEADDCNGIEVSKYKVEWSNQESFVVLSGSTELVGTGAGNADFSADRVVLHDNFTSINPLAWVTTGSIADVCGTSSGGGGALVFASSGDRYAITNDLDLSFAGNITFMLK